MGLVYYCIGLGLHGSGHPCMGLVTPGVGLGLHGSDTRYGSGFAWVWSPLNGSGHPHLGLVTPGVALGLRGHGHPPSGSRLPCMGLVTCSLVFRKNVPQNSAFLEYFWLLKNHKILTKAPQERPPEATFSFPKFKIRP